MYLEIKGDKKQVLSFFRKGFFVWIFLLFYQSGSAQKITFNKDIAPIVYRSCSPCHREGQSAPFSLITYQDFASRAKMISEVVSKRYMPPWKADPDFRHFENETCLKTEEIEKILAWVKTGNKEGKGKLEPYKAPELKDIRKPDYVIKMKEKFLLEGNNKETFAWIKVPYDIDTSRSLLDVERLEFVAGNKKLLHHVNYEILGVPSSLDRNTKPNILVLNNSTEFDAFNYLNLNPNKSYYYGGWLPGMNTPIYPEDMGVKLPNKGVLLYETMHYAASPVNDSDFSTVNIYYKKNRIERDVKLGTVGSSSPESIIEPPLVIPADSIKTFTATAYLQSDASLLYITPHMHLLGKKFVAYAILPSGDSIPLIRINDWDFNWQLMYQFNPILCLPKGTKLFVRATFDNTANNPRNPFSPPRVCNSVNGMLTTEEMLQLGYFWVSYREGDEKIHVKNE